MDGSEPFGKKDLFKVIHDSFIQSEDYQKSLEKLDENILSVEKSFINIISIFVIF